MKRVATFEDGACIAVHVLAAEPYSVVVRLSRPEAQARYSFLTKVQAAKLAEMLAAAVSEMPRHMPEVVLEGPT